MKGLQRSISRGPKADQNIVKETIRLSSLALEVDGATGVGWGTAVAGDFPQGNICLLGIVAYLQFSGPTAAGLVDTWAGDYGVGSTPATDGTITAGDVDLVPSTALAAATAEVSPKTRGVQADGAFAGVVLDNTDGSLEINVNLLVDDANISADDLAFTVDGEIYLSYVVLGDD